MNNLFSHNNQTQTNHEVDHQTHDQQNSSKNSQQESQNFHQKDNQQVDLKDQAKLSDLARQNAKCYTEKEPDYDDEKTISIGIEAARLLSRVDVGQTVVCRDRAVIAVEGIEGTDETLKRAGKNCCQTCNRQQIFTVN